MRYVFDIESTAQMNVDISHSEDSGYILSWNNLDSILCHYMTLDTYNTLPKSKKKNAMYYNEQEGAIYYGDTRMAGVL